MKDLQLRKREGKDKNKEQEREGGIIDQHRSSKYFRTVILNGLVCAAEAPTLHCLVMSARSLCESEEWQYACFIFSILGASHFSSVLEKCNQALGYKHTNLVWAASPALLSLL